MIAAGLDLGRLEDRSALAIVDDQAGQYTARHLDLWTPAHPEFADVPARIGPALEQHGPALAIDAGGLGRDVFPMIARHPATQSVDLWGLVATHGWRPPRQRWEKGGVIFVPKGQLIRPFFRALEEHRFTCPRHLLLAHVLRTEIENFRQWEGPDGLPRWGAKKPQHDDLITAVILAVWLAETIRTRPVGGFRPTRPKEGTWTRAGLTSE